jgi:2Fe-2S ferredoxin
MSPPDDGAPVGRQPGTVTVQVTDRQGHTQGLSVEVGQALMMGLAEAGLVEATCGGSCSCATCQVYVDPSALDRLPPAGDEEQDLIEGLLNGQDNSRLACQLTVSAQFDGLCLTVAPEQ